MLFKKVKIIILLITLLSSAAIYSQEEADQSAYLRAAKNTKAILTSWKHKKMCRDHGLAIVDVAWEDTARYYNSSVGPNISDLSLMTEVEDPKNGTLKTFLMPIIRYPNFTDETTELSPSEIPLLVGNQDNTTLSRISLRDFLADMRSYLSYPDKWSGNETSLLAERDSKVIVSAQACLLPVPQKGITEFYPVIFNYLSSYKNPAVLTILATPEGSSVAVIDNGEDYVNADFYGAQKLYFNKNGEKAPLTAQRLSDYLDEAVINNETSAQTTDNLNTDNSNLSMVYLIQVPLKYDEDKDFYSGIGLGQGVRCSNPDMIPKKENDFDYAVIGSGKAVGPFPEIADLKIERDSRYPIRVTVQFYKATASGELTEAIIKEIANEIQSVFDEGGFMSSLVTDGGTGRITEYAGSKVQPVDWWQDFWLRYEYNFSKPRHEGIKILEEHLGTDYTDTPVSDLYLHEILYQNTKH